MPEIREFQVGDGPALVELWRRGARRDPITPARFRTMILLDANFDPAGLKVAVEDGKLVGAAYAIRRRVAMVGGDLEPTKGWISFFFVAPESRRSGVGEAVLGAAVEWLRGLGIKQIEFSSYTPNYLLPGLDAKAYPEAAGLLAKLGFRKLYAAAAMDRSLVDYEMPAEIDDRVADLTSRGYRFGTPSDDDLVDLVRLAGEEFNPDWARAIRECLSSGTPVERIVCVRDPEGVLVGWAMHETYEGMTERFGPFGVLESQRGTGLGKVLLHLTLERMRGLGVHDAWFMWTGEQSAAGHLYRKTGFTTTRHFQIMRAEFS